MTLHQTPSSELTEQDQWKTIVEVAEWLNVSKFTLYDWVDKGYVTHRKLPNGRIQINAAALQAWLDENTHEGNR